MKISKYAYGNIQISKKNTYMKYFELYFSSGAQTQFWLVLICCKYKNASLLGDILIFNIVEHIVNLGTHSQF